MLWDISGANRDTGEDATIQIEADTRDSAIRRASRAGVLVSSAEPALIEFESEPTLAYESAPAFAGATFSPPPAFLPYASQSTGRPIGLPSNGLGIASLVLGCVSLLVIIVPCVNILSIPLALLGLVFGIISWVTAAKGGQSGIGFPIAGTSVSAVSLLILIGIALVVVIAISSAPKGPGAAMVPMSTATPMSPGAPMSPFLMPNTSAINQQQQILAAQQQANMAMLQNMQAQQRAAVQQRQMMQQMQLQFPSQPVQQLPNRPVQQFQPPPPPVIPGHR